MALTPDEIEGREFRVVDQGYDMVQVDTFLTEVAASYRYAVHNLLPGASGVGPAGDDAGAAAPVRAVVPGLGVAWPAAVPGTGAGTAGAQPASSRQASTAAIPVRRGMRPA